MTIEVTDLLKRYDQHFALHVPALRVGTGEALGLVGNNGAGKTTFLRLLLDLIKPDEGKVLIDGTPVARHSDWKAHVGSYLDESFLIDFLSSYEFFRFVGSLYEMEEPQIEAALAPFRNFLPTEAFQHNQTYIRELSLGNKKKVGLVAAMMITPRLLILDEPFANLDPGSQIRLKNLLRALRETHGTTMLISSHDLGHVTDICERIALLDDGQIVRDLTTSDATLRELEVFFTVD